jgi:hypothetical protein
MASVSLETVFATADSSQLRQTPSTSGDSLSITNEIDGIDISQLPLLSKSVRLTTDNGPF